jgi:hypothetical protein
MDRWRTSSSALRIRMYLGRTRDEGQKKYLCMHRTRLTSTMEWQYDSVKLGSIEPPRLHSICRWSTGSIGGLREATIVQLARIEEGLADQRVQILVQVKICSEYLPVAHIILSTCATVVLRMYSLCSRICTLF